MILATGEDFFINQHLLKKEGAFPRFFEKLTKSSRLMMTAHQVQQDNRNQGENGMSNERSTSAEAIYEIRVLGKIDPSWSDWFDGFTISNRDGETIIMGVVVDQAALLGILTKIGHLNLPLLSVMLLGKKDGQK
jgi:hypothetical protein